MEPVHVKSINNFQNALLVSSWKISLNCLLISISRNGTWTELEEGRWDGKTSFYYFIFFVNWFQVCFVQCFTIIIIKFKLSFSCHSSSSHYSTQGFVLISFHFIFSFLKNNILYNFTCDLLLCLQISELKCGQACRKNMTKNSQANGSLREKFSIFSSHLLALISRRNVGMRGHLRKEIILLKYQYFRFRTKTGAHFQLLNWLEKSTKAFDVGQLWYCSFYHPLGWLKNSETCTTRKSGTGTTLSASSVFTHTCIPLFDLYTTANDKSWCEVWNALKAV